MFIFIKKKRFLRISIFENKFFGEFELDVDSFKVPRI